MPDPLPALPTAQVVFPAPGGLTSASTLLVRGSAASSAGVAGVAVAGVAATSKDGFATWQASVPLALGTQTLDVVVTDVVGQQAVGVGCVVEREQVLADQFSDIAFDPLAGALYVTDRDLPAVIRFDPTTSTPTVIASESVGAGDPLAPPSAAIYDPAGDRLLVYSTSGPRIDAIDPLTHARTLITGAGAGSGPALLSVSQLVYEPSQKLVFAASQSQECVFAVDTSSGQRWVHSGPGVGSGPVLGPVGAMVLDAAAGRLLVGCSGAATTGLYAIDLSSGDRTLLSGQGVGTGPGLIAPPALVLDAAAGRCIVAQNSFPADLLSVDLASGDRVTFTLGGGPKMLSCSSMVLDEAHARIYAVDGNTSRVRSIDLASGEVKEVWASQRGAGPVPTDVRDVAFLPAGQEALLVDNYTLGGLLKVSLADGTRTLLSGTGPVLYGVAALVVDVAGDRALVLGESGGARSLLGIDLATGDRTPLSGGVFGSGPQLVLPVAMALDAAGGRVLVSDSGLGALVSIDLASGARTVLSDAVTGSGPVLLQWRGVVHDALQGRALVGASDALDTYVVSIDLSNGDRTVLASTTLGTGGAVPTLFAGDLDATATLLHGTDWQGIVVLEVASGDRSLTVPRLWGDSPALHPVDDFDLGADQVALVHDDVRHALLLLDLVTGERVIVSK